MFKDQFVIERNKANVKNAHNRLSNLWDAQHKRKNYDFYQALCETVMWIDISGEWFFQNDRDAYTTTRLNESTEIEGETISYEDLICGIRFIFNILKHNMDVTNLSKANFKELGENLYLEQIIFLPINEINVEDKFKNKSHIKLM